MYCLFLTKMFQKYKAVITSLLMHIWKYNKTEIVKRSPWHNLSKHYNTSRTFDSLIFSFHSQSFLLSQRESILSRIAAWFYIFTIFLVRKMSHSTPIRFICSLWLFLTLRCIYVLLSQASMIAHTSIYAQWVLTIVKNSMRTRRYAI